MRTYVITILLAVVVVIGANSVMAGSWLDQWYRAKYVRSSPMEEARRRAEQSNTPFRKELTSEAAPPANAKIEQW